MKHGSFPLMSRLFIVLSVVDLVLTWWLLRHSQRFICELNPFAERLIQQHGLFGMIGFKTFMVTTVLLLSRYIEHRRPKVGNCVVHFACTAVALVVTYRAVLAQAAPTHIDEIGQTNQQLELENHAARQVHQKTLAYADILDQLCRDYVAQILTLEEAVQKLAH